MGSSCHEVKLGFRVMYIRFVFDVVSTVNNARTCVGMKEFMRKKSVYDGKVGV